MNLRWLLGNFTDPQYKLSRRAQFRVSNDAHRRFVTWRAFLVRTTLIVTPFLVVFALLRPILGSFGYGGRNMPFFVATGSLVLLFWLWSAWMYRSLYVGPIRRAMREWGYDLCIQCGYELRGLDETVSRCPECGAAREFRPGAPADGVRAKTTARGDARAGRTYDSPVFGISHDRADESLKAKSRWFRSLTPEQRMAIFAEQYDLAFQLNPDIARRKDVPAPSDRVQVLELP